MAKPQTLAIITGTMALLIVTAALVGGGLAPTATLDAWAPWVGFGGAFLIFILTVRSRKS